MRVGISISEFMSAFTAFLLDLYAWTDSIYPFIDVDISLFWLFESTVLTGLAWQLFPAEIADNFVDIDEEYKNVDSYINFEEEYYD